MVDVGHFYKTLIEVLGIKNFVHWASSLVIKALTWLSCLGSYILRSPFFLILFISYKWWIKYMWLKVHLCLVVSFLTKIWLENRPYKHYFDWELGVLKSDMYLDKMAQVSAFWFQLSLTWRIDLIKACLSHCLLTKETKKYESAVLLWPLKLAQFCKSLGWNGKKFLGNSLSSDALHGTQAACY